MDIQKGDLIGIPVSSNIFAVAQVQYPGIVFLLAVYDIYVSSLEEIHIATTKPAIVAWTNDAEIYRKRWTGPVKSKLFHDLTLPNYKVYVDGLPMVENVDGSIIRPFDEGRDSNLRFRRSRSPKLVEECISSIFRGTPRPTHCDDMLFISGGDHSR